MSLPCKTKKLTSKSHLPWSIEHLALKTRVRKGYCSKQHDLSQIELKGQAPNKEKWFNQSNVFQQHKDCSINVHKKKLSSSSLLLTTIVTMNFQKDSKVSKTINLIEN